MKYLFTRLRDIYYWLLPMSKLIKDVTPPKPQHAPIRLAEMKLRITETVDQYLNEHGFEQTNKNSAIWLRPRVQYFHDYISLRFDTRPSGGLLGVMVYAGFKVPTVHELRMKLPHKNYEKEFATFGDYTFQLHKKKTIRTKWRFWNTAYSEEEVSDLVEHIEKYAFAYFDSVNNYDDLLFEIELRGNLFTENKAIIYALNGKKEKGMQILEEDIKKQETMQKNMLPNIDQEILDIWKFKTSLLKIIKNDEIKTKKVKGDVTI